MKRKSRKPAQRSARKIVRQPARITKAAVKKTAAKKMSAKKTSAKKTPVKKISAPPHDALDALVEAGAKALGLPLDPAWHASVKFNLQLVLRHAALVEEFPLPDDAEPAPVYHA